MDRATAGRDPAQVVRTGALAALHGLAVAALSLTVTPVLFLLAVASLLLLPVFGIGFGMFPLVVTMVRWRAQAERRMARWAGVDIPVPYRPAPDPAPYGKWGRFRAAATDPATWLDLAWLFPGTLSGAAFGLVAFVLPLYGLEGALGIPVAIYLTADRYGYGLFWPLDNLVEAVLSVPQGLLLLAVGLVTAPWVMWLHTRFAKFFLAPTPSSALASRVRELTVTRAETVDAQAAELRRIERDLHDGAQARLVSLSMSIGLAAELLRRDPDAALRLLTEAREASGEALVELRDLVRGIHPPVLAERGLDGAVRALALSLPLPVEVDAGLPGRPATPVESAAYFAVAEALANVVKHSGARTARVTVRHGDGALWLTVSDDGKGGADPAAGTGLRGIERRLAAFDGTMALSSPPGGPTVVAMELPCELSSPRTSPSSATD